VSEISERASYLALRGCPRADADAWWAAVRRRHDIPRAVAALLGGRARIELTREEAGQALGWARTIEGWANAEIKPLFVYPTNALGELGERENASATVTPGAGGGTPNSRSARRR
jgi:hypothetical protein